MQLTKHKHFWFITCALMVVIPSLVVYLIWFAKYNEMFAPTCTNSVCVMRTLDEIGKSNKRNLDITYVDKEDNYFLIYPMYEELPIKWSTLRITKVDPVTEDHIYINGFHIEDKNELKNILMNEANRVLNKESEIVICDHDFYFSGWIDTPAYGYPIEDTKLLNKPGELFIREINLWENIFPAKKFITKINKTRINDKGEAQIEAATSTNFANTDDNRIYILFYLDAQLENMTGIDTNKGLLDNLRFCVPEAIFEYKKSIVAYNLKHIGIILLAELLFFIFIFCLIKAVKQERNNQ